MEEVDLDGFTVRPVVGTCRLVKIFRIDHSQTAYVLNDPIDKIQKKWGRFGGNLSKMLNVWHRYCSSWCCTS